MKNWIKLYYHLIIFILVMFFLYTRRSYTIIYIAERPIVTIIMKIVYFICLLMIAKRMYNEKYNPNKDTMIKKLIRIPVITKLLYKLIDIWKIIYEKPLEELNVLLSDYNVIKDIKIYCYNIYILQVDKNKLLKNKEYKKIKIKHIVLIIIFDMSKPVIFSYFVYMYFFVNIVAVRWALILFTIFTIEKIITFWSGEYRFILEEEYEFYMKELEFNMKETNNLRKRLESRIYQDNNKHKLSLDEQSIFNEKTNELLKELNTIENKFNYISKKLAVLKERYK